MSETPGKGRYAGDPLESVDELISHLRKTGEVLWVPEPVDAQNPFPANHGPGPTRRLKTCTPASADTWDETEGLAGQDTELFISETLYQALCKDIQNDKSDVRRHSSRPIERAFVFVDVSDFSKLASGIQLLVVLALVRLSRESQQSMGEEAEAQLCIGDGYIYVFEDAVKATLFAAKLAKGIESAVAEKAVRGIPEFHFRIGVHAGRVRCFWDPGRNNWNYVGDGINGAQRVLSAIGKETDDVVYVSAQVRQTIQRNGSSEQVLAALDNKGRKADKHGNPWRVYQLNHMMLYRAVTYVG